MLLIALYLLVGSLAAAGSICWLAHLYHRWALALPDRPNDFIPATLVDVLTTKDSGD